MKQYTTPDQTAKLIELGLPKPRYYCADKYTIIHTGFDIINYSIGELIEMLPKEMDCELGDLGLSIENNIYEQPNEWIVAYDGRHQANSTELVDALYDMLIDIKEEGVI